MKDLSQMRRAGILHVSAKYHAKAAVTFSTAFPDRGRIGRVYPLSRAATAANAPHSKRFTRVVVLPYFSVASR
jgi:hypothetical protein